MFSFLNFFKEKFLLRCNFLIYQVWFQTTAIRNYLSRLPKAFFKLLITNNYVCKYFWPLSCVESILCCYYVSLNLLFLFNSHLLPGNFYNWCFWLFKSDLVIWQASNRLEQIQFSVFRFFFKIIQNFYPIFIG